MSLGIERFQDKNGYWRLRLSCGHLHPHQFKRMPVLRKFHPCITCDRLSERIDIYSARRILGKSVSKGAGDIE